MADAPNTSPDSDAVTDNTPEVSRNLHEILKILSEMPHKSDLQNWGTDLKNTIYSETATIKQDIILIQDSLDELEDRITNMGTDLNANTKSTRKHDQAILDLRRHTEDLENRSRRCNIRIRGVPENIPSEELRDLTTKLFSEILNDSSTPPIEIEGIHRAGVVKLALRYLVDVPIFCQQLDIPLADVTEWRNYILGPPDEDSDATTTSNHARDQTPPRQWRKRLNTQSPARLPSTPLNKKQS
ncbi:hypothetical protein XELAEV_18047730mg [Xenopus laevis]|uniref:Uncharacterized protein n=1 Tax=Xenopus laevis TaxID=8355 RepID=A0A974BVW0_XENLA|nr:hypothetical protein XELAEV_18047730mg [Xenopus laevis]